MKIVVAGAGAGKTTTMAEEVLTRYGELKDGKIIYVITYTNAARDHIRNKITEQHGSIPTQIKVKTAHAFLLQEIIFPFHHLLYGQLYSGVSAINLPDNHTYKTKKLKELREKNIIHVEEVTKIARYVVNGKSTDRKVVKDRRLKVISIIKKYLDSIFIDEAQDMDADLSRIIKTFYINEFYLYIVGDPKQDLRGRSELRQLISSYPHFVKYKKENYRCPRSLVKLSNKYVPKEESQEYQKEEEGSIHYLFEKDINISNFFDNETFEYIYIYQKNERFITSDKDRDTHKNLLEYELKCLFKKIDCAENHVEKRAFVLLRWVQKNIIVKNNWGIVNGISDLLSLELSSQDKARMIAALDLNREILFKEGIIVDSIDKVKGLEGDRCLFILTTELAEYFFQNKTKQNKMANYLYVALTRAKKELFILITMEVEERYGRQWIENKLKALL
ncbi:AAA family ATPase [Bacillus siamensis]|uniref:DNA helicase n=1 Tax=Bacillus siamensis TaxID=659243 RepID=A0AAI8HRX0_9BACI|nr:MULTISPECIES: UvrD-helicase domain-containing protein [Bacillus]AME06596.1 hypothetical protein AUL54_09620 [Bacillus sp. SDLI1]AUJ79070.1 hypothetical protein CWD84_20820 [Bacillus siamensis]UUA84475.1 AAA family ATPase [Bacillus siamensis]